MIVKCTIIYISQWKQKLCLLNRAGCCLTAQLLVVALQKVGKGGAGHGGNFPFPSRVLLAGQMIKSTGGRLTRENQI